VNILMVAFNLCRPLGRMKSGRGLSAWRACGRDWACVDHRCSPKRGVMHDPTTAAGSGHNNSNSTAPSLSHLARVTASCPPRPFLEGTSPAASSGAPPLEPPPSPPLSRRVRLSPDAATPGDGVENLCGTVAALAAARGDLTAAMDAGVADPPVEIVMVASRRRRPRRTAVSSQVVRHNDEGLGGSAAVASPHLDWLLLTHAPCRLRL